MSSGTRAITLTLDGTQVIAVADGQTLAFDILVVGRETDLQGSSMVKGFLGGIKNVNGTTALLGPIATTLNLVDTTGSMPNINVIVEANDALDALVVRIESTAPVSNDIVWAATVRAAEVRLPTGP